MTTRFSEQEALESAANAGATARPQLEQAIAERFRLRQAQAWTMLRQQFNQTSVVGQNIDRPGFDLCQNALMKVLDLEDHGIAG